MSEKQEHIAEATRLNLEIGLRLRQLRLVRGISQRKLGEELGISFQQIQKLEKGDNRLSAARLVQVAAFFEVPLMAFFEAVKGEEVSQWRTLDNRILRAAAYFDGIPDQNIQLALMKLIKSLSEK